MWKKLISKNSFHNAFYVLKTLFGNLFHAFSEYYSNNFGKVFCATPIFKILLIFQTKTYKVSNVQQIQQN